MDNPAVIIKSTPYGLVLNLDPDLPFEDLMDAVACKFKASADFFKNAKLALTFRGRALSTREEFQLVGEIVQNSRIFINCVIDEDPEHALRDKATSESADEIILKDKENFYFGTLSSGQTLMSDASVTIIGDVDPGAQVMAKGNIVVLGCCLGSVFAGSSGDQECFVSAVTLKPWQLKIANKTARSGITKRERNAVYDPDPQIVMIRDDHLLFQPLTGDVVNG